MKYAVLRDDGTAAALYDSAAHGRKGLPHSRVPPDAHEVSETAYETLVQTSDRPLPANWTMVRVKRNLLLNASDWTQQPDSPLSPSVKAAWADYRQSLRDLTNQDLANLSWPEAPQ